MTEAIALPITILILIGIVTFTFFKSTDDLVVYALAATVSLVGIHIHFGVSFYLSRIIVIAFLFTIFIKYLRDCKFDYPTLFLSKFFAIFVLTILFQIISTLMSPRIPEGLRQIAIHVALMTIFMIIVATSKNIATITNAIKIYLGVGFLQSLYGIYQVWGGSFNWITYQKILAYLKIPTANDHTYNGFLYSGLYKTFRAIGFYPADVSHYAGYLVGVLILTASFLIYNRRLVWPKIIFALGFCAIILSFSRSGMITLLFIGIPTLLYLLTRIKPGALFEFSKLLLIPMVAGSFLAYIVFDGKSIFSISTQETQFTKMLSDRYGDLTLNSLTNKNKFESLNEHIETRIAGLKAFSTSPFFGVGLGVNASPWKSNDYPRGWGGSHSHHLDMLGQTGLIGAILQTWFMVLVGKYMWKAFNIGSKNDSSRYLLAGLLASYVAIIIGNFLYHYFNLDIVWFLIGSGIALSRLRILRESGPIEVKSFNGIIQKGLR